MYNISLQELYARAGFVHKADSELEDADGNQSVLTSNKSNQTSENGITSNRNQSLNNRIDLSSQIQLSNYVDLVGRLDACLKENTELKSQLKSQTKKYTKKEKQA